MRTRATRQHAELVHAEQLVRPDAGHELLHRDVFVEEPVGLDLWDRELRHAWHMGQLLPKLVLLGIAGWARGVVLLVVLGAHSFVPVYSGVGRPFI